LKQYISKTLIKEGLGITDAETSEIQSLMDHPYESAYIFADMISRRAQIGWSTHGHSAVDVNIYGSAGTEVLRGNHENTEIGEFLRKYLDVDVDAVTKELNKKLKEQGVFAQGRIPTEEDIRMAEDHYRATRGTSKVH
jgi:alkaline phosphatase